MDGTGAGRGMAEIKNRIERLKSEVESLGPDPGDMPEMIETTNLLRRSEYYQRSDSAKSELISSYEAYVADLERLLRSVFEIQTELKDVLRDQSRLIADGRKTGARGASGRRSRPTSGGRRPLTRSSGSRRKS